MCAKQKVLDALMKRIPRIHPLCAGHARFSSVYVCKNFVPCAVTVRMPECDVIARILLMKKQCDVIARILLIKKQKGHTP